MIYMLGCAVIEWVKSSVDDTIHHMAENLEEVGRTIGQSQVSATNCFSIFIS